MLKKFTPQDVSNYYDQTEVHYKLFWKLEESMGLHYGIWDEHTTSIQQAVLNVNTRLIQLGDLKSGDYILDAGCGIGGSSFHLAKELGCKTHGISISQKQINSAKRLAKKLDLENKCKFTCADYTSTPFDDNSFDAVWAIESFGSAQVKEDFFKEMKRILKPGGKLLFADTFKPFAYSIEGNYHMQTMLNGWAISDILSEDELISKAQEFGFEKIELLNVSSKIVKSVQKIYVAGLLGMIGTKIYNLFYNATPFSKIHYKTGISQKKAFKKGDWGYYLGYFKLEN